jgi:hypothetical protein
VKLSGDVWRAAAILPRRMVHRYAPVWRDLLALRIGNSEPAVDLVREYLLRLADPAFAVHSVVAEVLGENLSTLLGVVVGHSVDGLAGDRLQRDLRLEALFAYMRRNCSDPDLSPSRLDLRLQRPVALQKYIQVALRQNAVGSAASGNNRGSIRFARGFPSRIPKRTR